MLRQSQAFAAFRQSLVTEGLSKVNQFVKEFNAEAEDIRNDFEKERPVSEALAIDKKRARTMDLVIRKNNFLKELQTWFKIEQHTRLEEYLAELKDEEENGKKIVRAYFPDDTSAKVSKSLWIDYTQFQRV